jgi:hypothetical protein
MYRIALFLAAVVITHATEPPEVIRHVTAGPEDIIQLNTATFEYSSIVLPEGEKAVTYLCGDPKHFDVQIIEGAERFVNVKPNPGAGTHPTNIQILTDHNHNYTVRVDVKPPVDLKLFVETTDIESLRKPPTFIPASEAERLRKEAEEAQKKLAEAKTNNQADMDKYQAQYARRIQHVYNWGKGGHEDSAPFHVHDVFTDSRFTYIKADPDEKPSFYAIKDGKPDLVEMEFDHGLYTIREIVTGGFLQIGKKRLDVFRNPGA